MDEAEVRRKLDEAIEGFLEEDLHLLENDLSERCIAARLAYHLQWEFLDHDELSVDVEYNRLGGNVKRLENLPPDCRRRKNRDEPLPQGNPAVVPDIIVHQRGKDGPNVLVIELKKTSNPEGSACDEIRIALFREQLEYECGALIECVTSGIENRTMRIVRWLPEPPPQPAARN